LGRHHVDDDHKELPIFVADAPSHPLRYGLPGSRDATGWHCAFD
jgi:hypothetical protein